MFYWSLDSPFTISFLRMWPTRSLFLQEVGPQLIWDVGFVMDGRFLDLEKAGDVTGKERWALRDIHERERSCATG